MACPSAFFCCSSLAALTAYLQSVYKKCVFQTYFLSAFSLTSPDAVLLFQACYHLLFQYYKTQLYQCQGQSFPDLTLFASQRTRKSIYPVRF